MLEVDTHRLTQEVANETKRFLALLAMRRFNRGHTSEVEATEVGESASPDALRLRSMNNNLIPDSDGFENIQRKQA